MTKLPFSIQKTIVQAKTRTLAATWTYEPAGNTSVNTMRIPAKPFHMILKEWYLTNYGYRVPFYETEKMTEVITWLNEHVGPAWVLRSSTDKISNSGFVKEAIERYRKGDLNYQKQSTYGPASEDIEMMLTAELAKQIQIEIDNEILASLGVTSSKLEKPTDRHFWFVSETDAILFKLTWGGE